MRTVNKSQPDTFGLFIQSRCHPFIANALWDRLGRNGEPKPVWRTNDRGILKTLKDFLGLGVNNSRRANAVLLLGYTSPRQVLASLPPRPAFLT